MQLGSGGGGVGIYLSLYVLGLGSGLISGFSILPGSAHEGILVVGVLLQGWCEWALFQCLLFYNVCFSICLHLQLSQAS